MKDKLKDIGRWILLLPASIIGSYLVYVIFLWMNSYHIDTGFNFLWNYIILFISQILMGMAFIGIGVYVAPSQKRIIACILFALVCLFSGGSLFFNLTTNFSLETLIGTLSTIGGAGYMFLLSVSEKNH